MGCNTSSPCKVDKKGPHGADQNQLKKRGRRCMKKIKKRGCYGRSKRGRSTNPFILFFLRMHMKRPKMPVVEVARKAGKLWCQMSINQRKKYIVMAEAERKRKEARKHKRKCHKFK